MELISEQYNKESMIWKCTDHNIDDVTEYIFEASLQDRGFLCMCNDYM